MAYRGKERRKYERYDMEAKVHFYADYVLKTKVKFQVVDAGKIKRYMGISRNISAEGMRFSSGVKLKKGDILLIELFLPKIKKPIPMTAIVRWSKKMRVLRGQYAFDTGARLITVEGQLVEPSIHFEEHKQVHWSTVLDVVFGSFHKFFNTAALNKKKQG